MYDSTNLDTSNISDTEIEKQILEYIKSLKNPGIPSFDEVLELLTYVSNLNLVSEKRSKMVYTYTSFAMLSIAIEGRSRKTDTILEKYIEIFPKLHYDGKMHENMLISFLAGITLEHNTMVSAIELLLPDTITNPTLHFNLACVYCHLDKRDKILYHAHKARKLGKLSKSFVREHDFDSIRNDSEFQELIK